MRFIRWQKIRSWCRPLLRLMRHELWPPNAWKTMGFTWLWLAWCAAPGITTINHMMKPGDHITTLMTGGGLLLFYGAVRSLVEANNLCRQGAWEGGEFFLLLFVGLPPLLIGGLFGFTGSAVIVQKLFDLSP